MTVHEVNGIHVEVRFNKDGLEKVILKKLIDCPDLSMEEIRQFLINDILEDRFLKTETRFTLSRMESEGFIKSELRPDKTLNEEGKMTASRYYRIKNTSIKNQEKRPTP